MTVCPSADVGERFRDSKFADLILQVVATHFPEAHMLDACSHELSSWLRAELNVPDFEGQAVNHLSAEDDLVTFGPVKHHNYLIVLFSQPL